MHLKETKCIRETICQRICTHYHCQVILIMILRGCMMLKNARHLFNYKNSAKHCKILEYRKEQCHYLNKPLCTFCYIILIGFCLMQLFIELHHPYLSNKLHLPHFHNLICNARNSIVYKYLCIVNCLNISYLLDFFHF